MRRDQHDKLETAGIVRVTELAHAPDERRPAGMTSETFGKLRRQASLQVRGRTKAEPIYRLPCSRTPIGFARLPAPSRERRLFRYGGRSTFRTGRARTGIPVRLLDARRTRTVLRLLGLGSRPGTTAFEAFIDFMPERRKRYPAMHVYPYAPYEKTALRKLAQLHC